MNTASWIVLGVLLVILTADALYLIKKKKKHVTCGQCNGDCAHCNK